MNCNQNSGCPPRRPGDGPGPQPCQRPMPTPQGPRPIPCQTYPGQRPMPYPGQRPGSTSPNVPSGNMQRPDLMPGLRPQGPGPAIIGPNQIAGFERYPVGMGYVPMQNWEAPFPMDRGFQRGTIFPSLDYPFVMGRCRG